MDFVKQNQKNRAILPIIVRGNLASFPYISSSAGKEPRFVVRLLHSPGAWLNSLNRKALPEHAELREALRTMQDLSSWLRRDFRLLLEARDQPAPCSSARWRLLSRAGFPLYKTLDGYDCDSPNIVAITLSSISRPRQ
ncbi:hypothetical protein [Paenibacillus macquariensis]|uniref:hypothetical protein n=1 Tax=Paenibacillus macquariensis TaxID=948756 RepID=UPI0011156BB6|nr:hypothetical protein [Paenibacillus macquariensis]MEC0090216.1 hypothetical protein [Paenibacillus macquariensis]